MPKVQPSATCWDVDEQFELPDLHDLVTGGQVDHKVVDQTLVYYDTPERHLQAHGILLRRRDGGGDAGWQLKAPSISGRTGLHWPPAKEPPASLTELLTGVRSGMDLTDVATVHTVRNRYRIRGREADELYAEVVDDAVRASMDEQVVAWREVHVEPGRRKIRKRLAGRLRSAGARPSRFPSKLALVLPPTRIAEPTSPAARALVRYLGAQIDAIVAGDLALRRGQDPFHDTRVAIRRLRSTLRVFGKLMDRSAIGEFDGELRWYAALLGDVRDCLVQRGRFTEALDGLPDDLVLGPVRSRIRNELQGIEGPARVRLREAMESPRYLAMMAMLRTWRTDPPVHPDTTTAKLLAKARRAGRKADERLAAALSDGDDDMLHRARKAAKRARYAAELIRPLSGSKRQKRNIKHYKAVQSVLGDHQDTVVASTELRRMALVAGTTGGENGFTYGLLFAREQHIAEDCRRRARELV